MRVPATARSVGWVALIWALAALCWITLILKTRGTP